MPSAFRVQHPASLRRLSSAALPCSPSRKRRISHVNTSRSEVVVSLCAATAESCEPPRTSPEMRRAARRIRQRWQGKLALALPAAAAAGVASSGGIQHLLQLAQANIKSLAALSGSAVLLVGLCVLFFLLPGIIRGEKRPAPVAAAVHAPGLETGSGSGIPLEIEPTGESSSRPDVLKQQNLRFVLPDGSGLDLLPGTYDVRVAASPIAADGTIYSFDEGVQHLVVTEHGLDPSTPLSLDLSPLAPESTSKEAVDRAYRYAARGGCPGDEAVGLKVAALNRIGVDPF